MPELIAITYPDEILAGQAAAELERRSGDLGMDPDAIGVTICERDGTSHLVTSRQPGTTAAWSRFWGELFAVMTGESEAGGLDADFRQRVQGAIAPGTSLMLFVIDRARAGSALAAVSQFAGSVLRSPLGVERLTGSGPVIVLPG